MRLIGFIFESEDTGRTNFEEIIESTRRCGQNGRSSHKIGRQQPLHRSRAAAA